MKTLESLILLAAELKESINRRSYGRQCTGQGPEVMSYVVGTEDGVFKGVFMVDSQTLSLHQKHLY